MNQEWVCTPLVVSTDFPTKRQTLVARVDNGGHPFWFAGVPKLLWGRTVRCARAVRKVGCFSPPVATGPRVLNSAPYSPCWYTRDFLF